MEPTAVDKPLDTSRPGGMLDMDSALISDLSTLIESGQRGMVLNILADLHPADLASVVSHIDQDLAEQVLDWLPVETAAEVLAELDDDYRAELADAIPNDRLTAMIDELDTDDAADVLADLPQELAHRIIPELEDAEDVKELLAYEEESAGGLMATEFVSVLRHHSVEQATEVVRAHAESIRDIFALFVVDDRERLVGIVTMKNLLLSPAETPVSAIMKQDIVTVPTDMDQEDVARLMERYDLVTLPVVDAEGCLVGRITIDDIVDVIRDEAEEDIQRMSGVAGGEEATDSVWRITRGRLPWLLVGLAGASLAALVIISFEESLAAASILAGFIPIVMATAGNAGIQSSAIAVQGLASGDIWASDIKRRLGKELSVAMLNGIVSSFVLGAAILLFGSLFAEHLDGNPAQLAFTASLALLIVIVVATTIGAMTPLLLDKMNIDPAIATGPFITTSNDILGILVFFLLADWLYL
jgi:magnesium transporter